MGLPSAGIYPLRTLRLTAHIKCTAERRYAPSVLRTQILRIASAIMYYDVFDLSPEGVRPKACLPCILYAR
jgi:hypothetical protein